MKHKWVYLRDAYAECRVCKRCTKRQYKFFDNTTGAVFWDPPVEPTCIKKEESDNE